MTMREPILDLNEPTEGAESPSKNAPDSAAGEASSPQRSKLDWDEMMLDYTAIERRAQEMRSEAAWALASSVRDWTMNLFRQGKAKAQAAAQAPLESHVQSS